MRPKGFTLIELLIVVAIIGILVSIISANLSNSRKQSRDARRVADIKTIQASLDQYFNDKLIYPPNIYDTTAGFAGVYLAKVPTDPGITTGCSLGTEAGCYKYAPLQGASTATCSRYHVGAIMEASSSQLLQDTDAAANRGGSILICTAPGGFSGAMNADFNGFTAGCSGATGSIDGCYDWTE